MRVLIIEDERKLADAIATGLRGNGYEAVVAHTGEAGLRHLQGEAFDLILLDIMLPRISGLQALRAFRRDGFKMPVLILTSRSLVEDRVRGLDSGADDYLVKPFAFPELLARLRALHRRASPAVAAVLNFADLRLDSDRHTAARGSVTIDLTGREFEVLKFLLIHRGSVVSREMLARDVWKTAVRYTSLDNVIDVHIARIRRKIDDPFSTKLIHTIRGVGFILRQTEED